VRLENNNLIGVLKMENPVLTIEQIKEKIAEHGKTLGQVQKRANELNSELMKTIDLGKKLLGVIAGLQDLLPKEVTKPEIVPNEIK
jgi:hypothetical protein